MCGIGAIFGSRLGDPELILRKSLEKVRHRGNRQYEIAVMENCALGANRLEIVDRANARQPQINEDGTVFAVLNGEVLNHRWLRKELLEKGHEFRTESDTEVLVHLWEEYRHGMVRMLDSEMFAFIIYDKKDGSVFAARDPYGVKPLYHAVDDYGNRHFASELKQLVQFPQIRQVNQFPPGCYLREGKLERYHSIPEPGSIRDSNPDMIVRLRQLFDASVRKRVDSDLPIGIFFSGGLDSTSVLSTARKFRNDVTAITVGRPDSPDSVMARRYCSESDIPLLSFSPPPQNELARLLPEIVKITESFEPQVIRYASVNYFIARLAKKSGFRIILSGDGSEELFAGYSVFRQCRNMHELSKWLRFFVRRLHRTQFQRVDRISMFHGLEVRLPFFDTDFADYAIQIPAELKLKEIGGRKVEKWIWRQAMKDRLPEYIAEREKSVLSEGAGYDINEQQGFVGNLSDDEFREIQRTHPDWNLNTKEAAYYFTIYERCGFAKAKFAKARPYLPGNSIKEKLLSLLRI